MAGMTTRCQVPAPTVVGLLSVPGVDGGRLAVSGAALYLIDGH
jgi:hypothetical protein